ncbi:MAG: YihY/virulence factor BrkB family protein [Sphingomicrobium sp.]
MPPPAWKDILGRTYKRTWDDNVGLVAAGVAFYAFFALLSLLAMIVLIYGLAADPTTIVETIRTLVRILPNDVASLIADQLLLAAKSSQEHKGFGLLVAFAVALYGGTNGAAALLTALNIAYEEKEKRSLFRFYVVAAGMALAALALALVAIVATAAIAYLRSLLPGGSPAITLAGRAFGYVALIAVAATIAASLYRFGPSREDARWKWITPGSVFTAITWLVLTVLFGLWVSAVSDYSATYGPLGAVVGLLTWLYLSAYVFILGAELNSEIEHQTARDSTTGQPEPMGERGAWAADNVATDDTVQDRPEEAREGERLTQSAPQVAEEEEKA